MVSQGKASILVSILVIIESQEMGICWQEKGIGYLTKTNTPPQKKNPE